MKIFIFLFLLLNLIFCGCATTVPREDLSIFEKIFDGRLEHFSYRDFVRADDNGNNVYGAVLYLYVNADGKQREFFKIAEDDYEKSTLIKIRDSLKKGQRVRVNLGLFDKEEKLEPFDSVRIL